MWYYNKETGNFSIDVIHTNEEGTQEIGWDLIQDRPIPYDDYIFDDASLSWIHKKVAPLTKQELKAIGKGYTLNGIVYQVPFTNDDAIGMMQVAMAFQVGITNTVIAFSNGVNMPIANTEFSVFSLWFAAQRNSFFIQGS